MEWTLTLTGVSFLAAGVWQLISWDHGDRIDRKRRFILSFEVESILVALLSGFHVLVSAFSSRKDWKNGSLLASAMSLESSGTALMFFVYSIAAVVKNRTRLLPLPREILRLLVVTGFVLEFFLFYMKEDDGTGVEGQYHRLLLVPIGICLWSTCLRIIYPASELLRFLQSVGLVLQGTWLFQMAVALFTKAGLAQGCWLDKNGDGFYAVHCKGGMNLMRAKAMATLQFNLHLAMLLLVFVPSYAFLYQSNGSESKRYQQLDSSGVQHEVQLSVSASPYVLDEEEDLMMRK